MSAFDPRPGETLDRLAGEWRIFQLRGGHRFSTDDLLTAWAATRTMPAARRLLDLGSGLGSVGLLALWRLGEEARLTSVEVQRRSYELAQRTIAYNGLTGRVDARHGDLRDPAILPPGQLFELVTGSPPYIPPERGVCSPHPQKAAARMELHGDIFDYCRAAARCMEHRGRFVFCHAAADPRPPEAARGAGLHVLSRRGVVFRADQPPLIALYVCAHAPSGHAAGGRGGSGALAGPEDLPALVIRGPDGRWTNEYLRVRREMGTVVWNPGGVEGEPGKDPRDPGPGQRR